MAVPKIVSFDDFRGDPTSHRSILLGNGFSRAFDDDVFAYKSIFENAGFGSPLAEIFGTLHTHDFEFVAKSLSIAAKIVACLPGTDKEPCNTLAPELSHLAGNVKKKLAATIIGSHPIASVVVPTERIARCIDALSPFNRVFTTNYDLLLYWMIAKYKEITGQSPHEMYCDGFGWKDKGSRLFWPSFNTRAQSVFYLHGALHLFPTDTGVEKLKYSEAHNTTLLEAIQLKIASGILPILVTEGESSDKINKIRSDPYLSRCLLALQWTAGHLVTYGFSFDDNDTHIADTIVHSRISRLSIGFHGEAPAKRLIEKGSQLTTQRQNYRTNLSSMLKRSASTKVPPPLEIDYFSTSDLRPWGTAAEVFGFVDESGQQ